MKLLRPNDIKLKWEGIEREEAKATKPEDEWFKPFRKATSTGMVRPYVYGTYGPTTSGTVSEYP